MALQDLMDELREKTNASRTTLRIDDVEGKVFPVKAESLGPGINSIAGDDTIPIRESKTFQWLDRERRTFVQDDIMASDVAPAPALMQKYGAKAQMLAPLVRDGELEGIISVHYAPSARDWSDEDVAALEDVQRRVLGELGW